MNVAINNRFSALLADRRIKEKRNIPLTEVEKKTGISYPTLLAWANNTVKRFDVETINRMCQYFEIEPGALFQYVKDELPPKPKKKK